MAQAELFKCKKNSLTISFSPSCFHVYIPSDMEGNVHPIGVAW